MQNYTYLMCTTPFGERCAQINDENYRSNAKIEARVYVNQLLRAVGENPLNTVFQNAWCDHEFGQYLDIRFYYDDEIQQHIIYMDRVERGVEKWDETALKELTAAGYNLPPEKVIPLTRSVPYADKQKGA